MAGVARMAASLAALDAPFLRIAAAAERAQRGAARLADGLEMWAQSGQEGADGASGERQRASGAVQAARRGLETAVQTAARTAGYAAPARAENQTDRRGILARMARAWETAGAAPSVLREVVEALGAQAARQSAAAGAVYERMPGAAAVPLAVQEAQAAGSAKGKKKKSASDTWPDGMLYAEYWRVASAGLAENIWDGDEAFGTARAPERAARWNPERQAQLHRQARASKADAWGADVLAASRSPGGAGSVWNTQKRLAREARLGQNAQRAQEVSMLAAASRPASGAKSVWNTQKRLAREARLGQNAQRAQEANMLAAASRPSGGAGSVWNTQKRLARAALRTADVQAADRRAADGPQTVWRAQRAAAETPDRAERAALAAAETGAPRVWETRRSDGGDGGAAWDAERILQAAQAAAQSAGAFEQASQAASQAAAAQQMMQAAALGASAAQTLLNGTLAASPLGWLMGAVMGVTALIYAACAAVSAVTGTTVSAAGVICGALAAAGAYIANVFIGIWNAGAEVFSLLYNLVATVANFIGTVFVSPVAAVCQLFAGMADSVLSVLQTIAAAIDAVFGSNLTGAVKGWRGSLASKVTEKYGKGETVMERMDADKLKLTRISYGEAWNSGYALGQSFGTRSQIIPQSGAAGGFYAEGGRLLAVPDSAEDVKTKVGRISGNTRAIRDSLELSQEDLKYLRDVAEMEAVNRFTTADIKIEQVNHNNIENPMDIDGIIDNLTAAMGEAVFAATEGVTVQ